MPAAAVIPAPKAYIKVVAVKKLVVDFRRMRGVHFGAYSEGAFSLGRLVASQTVTLKKLECSKRAIA